MEEPSLVMPERALSSWVAEAVGFPGTGETTTVVEVCAPRVAGRIKKSTAAKDLEIILGLLRCASPQSQELGPFLAES